MDDFVSVQEAIHRLLACAMPSRSCETALLSATGSVLAQDVYSLQEIPPFDRAMLDGYAVRAEDVAGATTSTMRELTVIGTALAGATHLPQITEGQAVRTMTGAPVAPGATAIVRLEWTQSAVQAVPLLQQTDKQVHVQVMRQVEAGEAIQLRGEGQRRGELLISAGTRLGPLEIGLLAAQGYVTVPVHSPPVVGVLTVGDELMQPGTALAAGHIYDSNSYMLSSLLQSMGVNVKQYPVCADDEEALAKVIGKALVECDTLVTAGGVSVGDRDITPVVLESLGGQRLFWGVWMRPGTPVYACTVAGKPVVCCSGNPFAAWVNALVLLWPMLERMLGQTQSRQWVVEAKLQGIPVLRKLKHMRYLQARLFQENGEWWADLSGSHSPGLLRSAGGLTALAVFAPGVVGEEGMSLPVLVTQM